MRRTVSGRFELFKDRMPIGSDEGVVTLTDTALLRAAHQAAGLRLGIGGPVEFQLASVLLDDEVVLSCVLYPSRALRISLRTGVAHPERLKLILPEWGSVVRRLTVRVEPHKTAIVGLDDDRAPALDDATVRALRRDVAGVGDRGTVAERDVLMRLEVAVRGAESRVREYIVEHNEYFLHRLLGPEQFDAIERWTVPGLWNGA